MDRRATDIKADSGAAEVVAPLTFELAWEVRFEPGSQKGAQGAKYHTVSRNMLSN